MAERPGEFGDVSRAANVGRPIAIGWRSRLSSLGRFLILFVLLPVSSSGQDGGECDLAFDVPSTEAAYRARDNGRCEGVYIEPVRASTRLVVRGFHVGALRYDLEGDREVVLQIAGFSPKLANGKLVAKSVRERHFYQMDTRAFDADGRFIWHTDVLRHPDVDLEPNELAVLYAVGQPDQSEPLEIWPVRLQGGDGNHSPRIPILILESEALLTQVRLRVESAAGQVVDERTLPRRSYPADRPIRVRLRVAEPAAYRVMLIAVSPEGAQGFTEFTAHIPAEALEGGG